MGRTADWADKGDDITTPSREEGNDLAAEAFEALRAEVAGLRGDVQSLPRSEPPDYAPTLAVIASSLVGMEQHPALRLTPDVLLAQLGQAAAAARDQEQRQLAEAVQRVGDAAAVLGGFAERSHSDRKHRLRQMIASVGGAAIGIGLWLCLAVPVARALPERWYMADRMAAATMHQDRWTAGQRLMLGADPVAWAQMGADHAFGVRHRRALAICQAEAERERRAVNCMLKIDRPG